jgi:hypothetical protein
VRATAGTWKAAAGSTRAGRSTGRSGGRSAARSALAG